MCVCLYVDTYIFRNALAKKRKKTIEKQQIWHGMGKMSYVQRKAMIQHTMLRASRRLLSLFSIFSSLSQLLSLEASLNFGFMRFDGFLIFHSVS